MKESLNAKNDNSHADAIHALLPLLGFRKALVGDRWERTFPNVSAPLEVDCDAGAFLYEKIGITVSSATTANFSQPENFVVFECVCRLLEKGYRPKDIELEPEWKLGHTYKGGRADIWVRTAGKGGKKDSLLIIECKTWGREFAAAWRDTLEDGAQLFSYFQQERGTKFLCLYASGVADGKVVSDCRLVNVQDNADYLKTLPKARRGGYASATSNKQLFAVWRDTYQYDFATQGLFEKDIAPYHPGKNKYSADDLRELDHETMRSKYNEFATILRQHNVSGHENAFDKLVNLFLAKVVDEKRNGPDLAFHWKGIAYDSPYDLQDRLQRLYTKGMKDFLGETVTYIDESAVRKAFGRFADDPDATKTAILEYFRQLKFYTNNDFAFLDVHNKRLFEENFAILLKIVRMLEDLRLRTDRPNQFLGDLFEGYLNRGVKQSEGQFFTPPPIVRFIVSSLPLQELVRNLAEPPRVIDYACGAGHFLTEYAHEAKPFIDAYASERAGEFYSSIIGVEKEYRLSKVSKVAAFMYGQDGIQIVYADALAKNTAMPEGAFDIIVANPPYSVNGFLDTLPEEDRNRYELSSRVSDSAKFDAIETFFVERAAQLLKPLGIAGIVLPSSILSNGAAAYVRAREILLETFEVVALAEFGSATFGETGTNTVVAFLRKRDSPPDFADHCRNRAAAWFAANHDGDDVFGDAAALSRYCSRRGFAENDYRSFLAATDISSVPESILDCDSFRALRADFGKQTAKQKWAPSERARAEWDFLRKSERRRLFYFLLADSNPVPVLLVRSPDDNKAAQAFLGYKWSKRRGREGIQYLGVLESGGSEEEKELSRAKGIDSIKTPLFDPDALNREDVEKLNSLVRKNFRGTLGAIPESLRPFARTAPLADLLDFDAADFDLQIRTGASASAAPVASKFPLVRLGDVAEIGTGNSAPQDASAFTSGTYPFFRTADVGAVHLSKALIKTTDHLNEHGIKGLKLFRAGTILFPKSGASTYLDHRVIMGVDGYVSSHLATIVPNAKQVLLGYLFEALARFRTRSIKVGSGYPSLNVADIAGIKIPLPPLSVQRQVAEECAAVDADCAKAEKAIADGKAKIAAIMAGVKGEKRKLESLLVKVSGETTKIPESQIRDSGSIPVVTQETGKTISGYTDNVTPITDLPLIVFGDHSCSFKFMDRPFVRGADGTQLIKTDASLVNPKYLFGFLRTAAIQNAGKYERHFKYLKSVMIPLPSLAEQKRIVGLVEAEEAAIAAAKGVLSGAAARKAAILAKHGIVQ